MGCPWRCRRLSVRSDAHKIWVCSAAEWEGLGGLGSPGGLAGSMVRRPGGSGVCRLGELGGCRRGEQVRGECMVVGGGGSARWLMGGAPV